MLIVSSSHSDTPHFHPSPPPHTLISILPPRLPYYLSKLYSNIFRIILFVTYIRNIKKKKKWKNLLIFLENIFYVPSTQRKLNQFQHLFYGSFLKKYILWNPFVAMENAFPKISIVSWSEDITASLELFSSMKKKEKYLVSYLMGWTLVIFKNFNCLFENQVFYWNLSWFFECFFI